jgi:peptide/nickel transport system permease protein
MSGSHWLGLDSAGRDILSRILVGARTTLLAAALAAIVSAIIGVPAGLIAGYYRRAFESVANWVTNVLMSLPAIIVLLAVTAALGKSVWISMSVFGVLMSPGFYRLTLTSVQAVRGELFVDAARVSGLSDRSIIGKHILFVVRAPLIIQASIICGIAINIQAALEFLGLGDPTVPTWGVMLSEGFINLYTNPMITIWSGTIITVTIGAFVVLGNALRDALEDKPSAGGKRRRIAPMSVRPAAPADTESGREQGAGGPLLSVRDLAIGYPKPGGGTTTVVSQVSFDVHRGEVLGLVGESGSGKTQTAFSILGLLPEDARLAGGAIDFDGTPLVVPGDGGSVRVRTSGLRGRRIAYIPQEPMSNLDPNYTIGHQLVRPMVAVLGISKSDARTRALELLDTVGIADPERTFRAYPYEDSGGMAQRVLIAGAVSCHPDLLIADEPTTALDVTVQAEVLDLLRSLQQTFTMGVVMVTHNFGVVADICDSVVVMQNGRVVEQGPVRDILRHPSDPYTVKLLSAMLEGKPPLTMLTKPDDPAHEQKAGASHGV